jgi:DNA-binding transcriptional regulator PaaX
MQRFVDGIAPMKGRWVALPRDWPGAQARVLFASLRRLAPASDAAVAARFLDRNGPSLHNDPVRLGEV